MRMNKLIEDIITRTFLNKSGQLRSKEDAEIRRKKLLNDFVINSKRITKDSVFILIGIISAGFGLKGFLLPNDFIDGGAMGISLLRYELTNINLSYLIIAINIPFIILGIRAINLTFAIKTILAIILLAIVVAIAPFPEITNDKLLISIFGGFFLGTGIGLTIRGGAVIDGTEILAIYASRRLGSSIGDVIMVINVIIFSFAAYLLSIETAMYAMLTYLSASKTVDFIVEGFEEYMGITIVSDHCTEICDMIKNKLDRGYTIYKQKKGSGKKGIRNEDAEIVYTVITRLEMGRLYSELEKIDPDAFIISQSVKNIKGGLVKKCPLAEH